MVGGGLLLGKRSAPTGGALLAVVVAIGMQPRVVDTVRLGESSGPRAGTGYALLTAGFVLALVAAVIGAVVVLRPRDWGLRGGARPLAVLAALAGFGAAVGYGMNPFSVDSGRASGRVRQPARGDSRRQCCRASSGRHCSSWCCSRSCHRSRSPSGAGSDPGLALGLLFAIGGIAAFRVGEIYGTIGGRDTGFSGAEGTWTFLAAGGAALIMTFAGLAGGGRSAPVVGARSAQPETAPPPMVRRRSPVTAEATEPVVVPDATTVDEVSDDASDESGDASTPPAAPAPGRVEPMPDGRRVGEHMECRQLRGR